MNDPKVSLNELAWLFLIKISIFPIPFWYKPIEYLKNKNDCLFSTKIIKIKSYHINLVIFCYHVFQDLTKCVIRNCSAWLTAGLGTHIGSACIHKELSIPYICYIYFFSLKPNNTTTKFRYKILLSYLYDRYSNKALKRKTGHEEEVVSGEKRNNP